MLLVTHFGRNRFFWKLFKIKVIPNACFTIQAILLDPNMNMGEKIQAIMNTVKEHAGEIVKVTFSLQLPQSYGKRCRKSKMSAFIMHQ